MKGLAALLITLISISAFSSQRPNVYKDIKTSYNHLNNDSKFLLKTFYFSRDREYLKSEVLKRGAKAAPVLTAVMKDARFNERNRWTATFLLGRVVGRRSSSFIRKFTKHPNWILRLASLKTLTALNDTDKQTYLELLNDSSMIVRLQALDSIEKLKMNHLADYVLKMLFNPKNYQQIDNKLKRSNLIAKAITVLGNLQHSKSLKAFKKLIHKPAYEDIKPYLKLALAKAQ